jgi:hypothetical protein
MRLRAAITLGGAVLATVLVAGCSGSGGGSKSTPSAGGSGGSSASAASGPHTLSALTGTSSSVALAPAFASLVTKLKITPGAYGTGKLAQSGGGFTMTLPVTGGSVTVAASGTASGTVQHAGSGLTFAAQGETVQLRDLVLDETKGTFTGTVYVDGSVLTKNLELFDIDLKTQKATVDGSTATLSGGAVYVAEDAAQALNLGFRLTGANALPTTHDAVQVGTLTTTLTGTPG